MNKPIKSFLKLLIPRSMRKHLWNLKKGLSKMIDRIGFRRIRAKVPYKWYGNDYGGFYVAPPPPLCYQRCGGTLVVYSAGVGEDISFDTAFARDYDCAIYAFDPTPRSIEWIKQQNTPANYVFMPCGVSGKTETQKLHLSNTPLDISASICVHRYTEGADVIEVRMRSLKDIAAEYGHRYIDILKMDIEGSEFEVIESLAESGLVFGQILVEFHERFFENGKHMLKRAFATLRKNGYYLFAISEHGDEYSFINKRFKLLKKQ